MNIGMKWAAAGAAGVVLLGGGTLWFRAGSSMPRIDAGANLLASQPLHFEPSAAAGAYVARGRDYTLELDAEGATLHLRRGQESASLGLQLVGAAAAVPRGEVRLGGFSNYYLGDDPARWRANVPHYQRVKYRAVYPGVDVVYYGAGRDLEYDFIVAPGADPAQIQLSYAGARAVRIDGEGNLRVAIEGGEVLHRKPVVYQTLANGLRESVAGAFRLARNAASTLVTFDLGDYDTRRPLVIDPVLTYATYLGGNSEDALHAVAVDAAGAIYAAGSSMSIDLPAAPGVFDTTHNGGTDAFVAKLDPSGTAVVYATYLGGSSFDEASAIRIDASGAAHVMGTTSSNNFPTSAGAPQSAFGGAEDVFVAKLSATGASLVYSTYLGGSNQETSSDGGGFEIDAAGNAYVYAVTSSTNFPTTAGAPQAARGNPNGAQFDEDAFLTKINAAGNAFLFSTYHGGSSIDQPLDTFGLETRQLAIDASGSAWIAGSTESADFPVTPGAFDTTFNGPAGGNPGGGDAFVTRFDTVAGTRLYSTLIGGAADEYGGPLAVDSVGNVYATVQTASADFPVTAGAFDATYNGGASDVAVVKLAPTGAGPLLYGTFLGGSAGEGPAVIRVDAAGAAYLAGSTQSADFPTAGGADTTHNGGGNDGFIAKLNAAGSALEYSTFAGSGDGDGVAFMEIDAAGSAYAVLGDTLGNAPVTTGGRPYVGNVDDYFVKLNVAGSAFLDGSYIGGGGDDSAFAMTIDAQQNLYLVGSTDSTDYPTTAGVLQPAKANGAGNTDSFVVKFATTPDIGAPQPGVLAFTSNTFNTGEGAGSIALTVSRSGGSSGAVSVTCTPGSSPGFTAAPGVDYTASAVTLTWADGDSANKSCDVPLAGDATVEGDETFEALLSTPTGGATLGTPAVTNVTIIDDDVAPVPQPGTVSFNPAAYTLQENGGSVTLTLTRTGGADGAISVSVASGGGSAAAGSDYSTLTQTLSWANGDAAAKTVALLVSDDAVDESDETITLTLANATGGATLGTVTASVTIADDDSAPGPEAQNTSVKGSYGKGSMDAGLLALLLFVLACAKLGRRRVARMAACTAVAVGIASTAGAQAADGWYLGVRAGAGESTQRESDLKSALDARGHEVSVDADAHQPAYTLFAGYRFDNGLALEAGLVELGEYEVTVSGTTTSPATLLADTQALLADAGRAVSATLAWHLPLGERLELTPRLGAYYWESRRSVVGIAGRIRDQEEGVDLTAGITIAWRLDERWSLGLGWESWAAGDRNDLRVWNAALVYRLGR